MTDTDKPATLLDEHAIRMHAYARVGYLHWLAAHLLEPKYGGMLPIGREDIRKAAARELQLLAGE